MLPTGTLRPGSCSMLMGSGEAQRILEEGEEMTAPGPAWSAEEEDLLRSLAAAGESAAAIAALLKRSYHAIRNRADVLKINLARSLPGPKPKWK
jgi:hypothetical protein